MRGKRKGDKNMTKFEGITPAGAGKTTESGARNHSLQDHPRRCGENTQSRRKLNARSGSPPQVRGKLGVSMRYVALIRITPAGAGKTVFGTDRRTAAEDHPRRCGENTKNAKSRCMSRGSPPQVRGKRALPRRLASSTGITPAGAGKTDEQGNFYTRGWDHPRRCGENRVTTPAKVQCRGSPPQVRGKLGKLLGKHGENRITPAGAGKTGIYQSFD